MSDEHEEIGTIPIQTDQTDTEIEPIDFLSQAVQTTQVLTGSKIPGPDDKDWKTYWSAKDKDAWALVWDSFVTGKESLYEYYKSGTSVPYTFNSADSIDGTAIGWGLSPMAASQRDNARSALSALGAATGLSFTESSGKVTDGLVITMCDLGGSTYGQHFFDSVGGGKYQYTIALNRQFYGPDPKNAKTAVDPLTPGETKLFGYVTLLHELAHAAGLDDAEGSGSDSLSSVNPGMANTDFTVMGYSGKTINTAYTTLDRQSLSIIYRRTETKPKPVTMAGVVDTEFDDIDNLDDSFTPGQVQNGSTDTQTPTPVVEEQGGGSHEEESGMLASAVGLSATSLADLVAPPRNAGFLAHG
jgi:hypothetical protein